MSQLTDDILSRVDIVDVISRYVSLKKSGSNFSGLSPFQSEKTPSFMVSPQKQIFKDFSSGIGGNVITFVMEIERVDFWDAVKILAEQANIDLSKYHKDPQKIAAQQDKKEKIKNIHNFAQNFFLDQLDKNDDARTYLTEKRKISREDQQKWGIGYAPDSHYDMISYLKSKGFSDQDMIDASLAKQGNNGDIYAFFRNRITFPIKDHIGNIIAFGARVINPEDMPKYLNSSDHNGYDKSRTLYGLDRAKIHVKDFGYLILVEGYMDVIALDRLGFAVGVASCGTALTHEHLKIIKRYTDTVYLLFDSDNAGVQASIKALSMAYSQNIYPKMINLPDDCKDVDDLANIDDGRQIFEKAIEHSNDGFVHIFEVLKKQGDWDSPIGKQKIINIMFEMIMSITSSPSTQKHYIEVLADKIGLNPNLMEAQYIEFRKKNRFIQKQHDKQNEEQKRYRPDPEMLFLSFMKDDFYKKYSGSSDQWENVVDFMKMILRNLDEDHSVKKLLSDESMKAEVEQLQVWWEKELDVLHGEQEQIKFVKNTLKHTIHTYIKQISKSAKSDHETKMKIMNMLRQIKF